MQRSIIIGLIISVLLVIFASSNSETTEITFFFWQLEGPLALLIFGSFVAGASLGIFLTFPRLKRKSAELKKVQKALAQFNTEKLEQPENKSVSEENEDKKESAE